MIPAEAVDAAEEAVFAALLSRGLEGQISGYEQTRLAHLDAMVNRETKRGELAAAWEEGEEAGGANHAAEEYGLPIIHNPYHK